MKNLKKLIPMKSLVDLFYTWYSSQVRHPKYRWFMIIGTLFYLFSPLDISSDFLPILGWIDDGIVLTLLTTELSRLVMEQRKNRQEIEETSETDVVEANVVG